MNEKKECAASRRERAVACFEAGCSCAEAVAMAFSDLLPVDEKTVLRLASPFGGGLARQREVCGAVSGLCLVTGLLYGRSDATDAAEKKRVYVLTRQLCDAFREKNGSIVCRELLGLADRGPESPVPTPRTPDFYQKRPCPHLVGDAAEILEKYIAAHPPKEA